MHPSRDQPTSELMEGCIYAVRHSVALKKDLEFGSSRFIEQKPWASALEFLARAKKTGRRLPIVFAHSERIDGVRYGALIDEIEVASPDEAGNRTTTVCCSRLVRLEKKHPLRDLQLKSSKQPLSDDFIRSYAICYTPQWFPAYPISRQP